MGRGTPQEDTLIKRLKDSMLASQVKTIYQLTVSGERPHCALMLMRPTMVERQSTRGAAASEELCGTRDTHEGSQQQLTARYERPNRLSR